MLKIIGSAHPRYLAATDVLIGDMSNINYEYLIYNKPIVLLANNWVNEVFPDIGIKTNLSGIKNAVERSIKYPDEYYLKREKWKNNSISFLDQHASIHYIQIILRESKLKAPVFLFITGGNSVRETNITPLYKTTVELGYPSKIIKKVKNIKYDNENTIFVGAHFVDLKSVRSGFKVHIDHDLKGIGSSNLEYAIWDYKRHKYFPNIDLHIVAGKAGEKRTKLVLGPNANRVVVGGYPKADDFIRYNTQANKENVYDELGLVSQSPLITYAPAGKKDFMKPGGSLSDEVLDEMNKLSAVWGNNYNILIKMKYKSSAIFNFKNYVKRMPFMQKKIIDSGYRWKSMYSGSEII